MKSAEKLDKSVGKRSKKRKIDNTSATSLEIAEKETGNLNDEDSAVRSNSKKEIDIESDDETEQVVQKKSRKRKRKKKHSDDKQKAPGDKSNRQLKREKQAVKEAEVIVAKQLQTTNDAHNYLRQWKNDRNSWKFMKAKQIWLHNHKFDQEKVPDEIWPIFIEYFTSAKGNAKILLTNDAKKIIAKMEEWVEKHGDEKQDNQEDNDSENVKDGDANENKKPDELVYERARSIIQNIQE